MMGAPPFTITFFGGCDALLKHLCAPHSPDHSKVMSAEAFLGYLHDMQRGHTFGVWIMGVW